MATQPQMSRAVTAALQFCTSIVQNLQDAARHPSDTPNLQQKLDESAQAMQVILRAFMEANGSYLPQVKAVHAAEPSNEPQVQPGVRAAEPSNEPQVQPGVRAAEPSNEPQVQPAEPSNEPQPQPVVRAAEPSNEPQPQPGVRAAEPSNEPQVQPAESSNEPQVQPGVRTAEQPGVQSPLQQDQVQFYPPMNMNMDEVKKLMARIENVRKALRMLRDERSWRFGSFMHCNVLILYATMLMNALGVLLPRGSVEPSVLRILKHVKKRCAQIGTATQKESLVNKSPRNAWKPVRRRHPGYITEYNMKTLDITVVKPLADYLLHVFDHIEMFPLDTRFHVAEVQVLAARLHFYEKPKTLRLAKISQIPSIDYDIVRNAHGALWRLWETAPVIDVDRSDYFVVAMEYLDVLRACILGMLSAGVTSKKVAARLLGLKALNYNTPTRKLEHLAKGLAFAPCTALDVCQHFDVVYRIALRLRQTCCLGGTEVDFCGLLALIQLP
jgi:hypothetical protein